MKIVIIGASGTIGTCVASYFESANSEIELIKANSKDLDIANPESIQKFFEKIGKFDHLISTTGQTAFEPFLKSSQADWALGFDNKLMGQINLVKYGVKYLNNPNGSFTITSGIIADQPIRFGMMAGVVGGALNAFVKAAALELRLQCRVNAISPNALKQSFKHYQSFFRGFVPVDGSVIGQNVYKLVFGLETGQIKRIGY